jgi:hypoxanthine-DNA glycosylase
MLETHPFGSFVPPNAKFLILGSFTTKEAFDDLKKAKYVWFYSNGGRNQFWPMLEKIYGTNLQTRDQMKNLLIDLKMGIADIIYKCERVKKSNLDVNLTNIVYSLEDITHVLEKNKISKIFFTSRFVESKFKTNFKAVIANYPGVELITLPSPSPRYVQMTHTQKLKKYKDLLPSKS